MYSQKHKIGGWSLKGENKMVAKVTMAEVKQQVTSTPLLVCPPWKPAIFVDLSFKAELLWQCSI